MIPHSYTYERIVLEILRNCYFLGVAFLWSVLHNVALGFRFIYVLLSRFFETANRGLNPFFKIKFVFSLEGSTTNQIVQVPDEWKGQ